MHIVVNGKETHAWSCEKVLIAHEDDDVSITPNICQFKPASSYFTFL